MTKGIQYRKFDIKKSSDSYRARACRYALSQLTQAKGVISDDREIREALADLIRLRRKRLFALHKAGWNLAIDRKIRIANCPPVSVVTDQMGLWPCWMTRWCPFCWCRRYVLEMFGKFKQVMFREDAEPSDLIEVRTDRLYDCEVWELPKLVRWISRQRTVYLRKQLGFCTGAFVLCTIEPPEEIYNKRMQRIRHRLLAIVPRDAEDPSKEVEEAQDIILKRTVNRSVAPDRHVLAGALGRTALYPAGMLSTDYEEILNILEATANTRMAAVYGDLRNIIPEDIEPEPDAITVERAVRESRT